jgi:hypothetical protein
VPAQADAAHTVPRPSRAAPRCNVLALPVRNVHMPRETGTIYAMERQDKEPEVKAQVGAHDSSRSTTG